jgi:hypothetical protein
VLPAPRLPGLVHSDGEASREHRPRDFTAGLGYMVGVAVTIASVCGSAVGVIVEPSRSVR